MTYSNLTDEEIETWKGLVGFFKIPWVRAGCHRINILVPRNSFQEPSFSIERIEGAERILSNLCQFTITQNRKLLIQKLLSHYFQDPTDNRNKLSLGKSPRTEHKHKEETIWSLWCGLMLPYCYYAILGHKRHPSQKKPYAF